MFKNIIYRIRKRREVQKLKSSSIIRAALAHYKENELIFASRLYKETLSECISEAAYYKMLERMYKNGELGKAAKGIYYIPNVSKYGILPPSEKQIIEAFTQNETGTIIGYTMYNNLNLTTQVSKTVDVLSSALEGATKTVRNVVIRQAQLEYSEEVKKMICGLEVLQNFYEIQDINYSVFIDFSRQLASSYQNEVFEMVISKVSYKKSTISFLQEILKYYNVPNNLEQYLSSLSIYKHPRMEELYDITRVSRGI